MPSLRTSVIQRFNDSGLSCPPRTAGGSGPDCGSSQLSLQKERAMAGSASADGLHLHPFGSEPPRLARRNRPGRPRDALCISSYFVSLTAHPCAPMLGSAPICLPTPHSWCSSAADRSAHLALSGTF